MPITSSAKKALRSSKRKSVFNVRRQKTVQEISKQIKKLVSENKGKEAFLKLPLFYKAIDKAAKIHLITKNTASRKKSRISALIKKANTK